jgi:S-adenosylmethionine-diacylglycerol 3-amino-3-carboxypropyl transferase
MMSETEISGKASFDAIRYAQCWEDADILLEALDIKEDEICLGIGSAGENCLSMLSRGPEKVVAVDMNPAQLACIDLRVAAFKCLSHQELLELIGSRPSEDRLQLFEKCTKELKSDTLSFWRANTQSIVRGIGSAGKFERYFSLFRRFVLPLIHGRKSVRKLLEGGDLKKCRRFYDEVWDNLRWRMLFKLFFSRRMMGRLGRDPSFFAYVEGSVAERILLRAEHALKELNPGENPYLHWILTGSHGDALPHALRPENYEKIRRYIDRFEYRLGTLESVLDSEEKRGFDKYNLSDIFEYMDKSRAHQVMDRIVKTTRSGGRLAYWNMLVPRSCPPEWHDRIIRHTQLGESLLRKDKAFFYSAMVVEEVL